MKAALDQAQAENFIPWAETMSAYITAEEATARYANLQAFYAAKGHFWVGIGPFYVDQINAVEGSVVAKRYEAYPELASKWSIFGAPPLSVVDVSGPGSVTKGQEAAFDAFITFQDAPYASADLSSVSYLLYDASGALVGTGAATAIAEGQYQAVLTAAQTGALAAGSAKIEFVVVSKLVAIPTFASMEFVVSQ
jgi:peptide/nickel transport system substrate-binding protein